MKRLFIMFSAIAFLIPSIASADEANIGGTGNTVKLLENQDVQMVSEVVNLTVKKKANEYNYDEFITEVHVTYNFKNTSDQEVTVKMGFPEKKEYSYDDQYKLNNFTVLDAEGKEIQTTFRDEEAAVTPEVNWYIHEETFAPNEEKQIQNKYWIHHSSYKSGHWTNYILETGATWKDNIEKAEINLILEDGLTPYDITELSPKGFTYNLEKNTVNWTLTDLEPTKEDNIAITFGTYTGVLGCFPDMYDTPLSEAAKEDVLTRGSSFLVEENYLYDPCLAYDSNPETAWVEGVEDNGINEWIKFPIYENKTYKKVQIYNGFRTSRYLWDKNNRIKTIAIKPDNAPEQLIELADTFDSQIIDLKTPITNASEVTVTIKDIYKGSKFADTALSEIKLLGLIETAKPTPIPATPAFTDISNAEYQQAITYLKEEGIIKGYEDGSFKPKNKINRAEFTKIIIEARFPKDTSDNCKENFFPDTQADTWYTGYICVAKTNNILEGYPDGTFKPEQNIEFTEAAKIILNSFNHPVQPDELWYKPYVNKMETLNAIPTSIESLDKHITREEMSEMIYRLLKGDKDQPSKTFNL